MSRFISALWVLWRGAVKTRVRYWFYLLGILVFMVQSSTSYYWSGFAGHLLPVSLCLIAIATRDVMVAVEDGMAVAVMETILKVATEDVTTMSDGLVSIKALWLHTSIISRNSYIFSKLVGVKLVCMKVHIGTRNSRRSCSHDILVELLDALAKLLGLAGPRTMAKVPVRAV